MLPLIGGVPQTKAITIDTGGIPDSAFGVKGAPTNCTYTSIPAPRPGFQCLAANTAVFTGATFDTAKFEKVTYRAGVDYQLTENSLLYASLSTGFSSGVFNGSQTAAALGRATFKPQNVRALEISSKNRFADNRVQLNLSAFYNSYTGLQEQRQVAIGVTTTSITENSGRARSYGAEVEAIWKPVRALTLNASFAYLNARYTRYDQVAAPFGTSILVVDATALTPTIVDGVIIAPAGRRRVFAVGYDCGLIPERVAPANPPPLSAVISAAIRSRILLNLVGRYRRNMTSISVTVAGSVLTHSSIFRAASSKTGSTRFSTGRIASPSSTCV